MSRAWELADGRAVGVRDAGNGAAAAVKKFAGARAMWAGLSGATRESLIHKLLMSDLYDEPGAAALLCFAQAALDVEFVEAPSALDGPAACVNCGLPVLPGEQDAETSDPCHGVWDECVGRLRLAHARYQARIAAALAVVEECGEKASRGEMLGVIALSRVKEALTKP